MAQAAAGRAAQDFFKQGRRLLVRQVAVVAQHALDQRRQAAAVLLQVNIMIELKREQVDVGKGFSQVQIPGAQVGGVGQGQLVAEQTVRDFEAKAKGCRAVMAQRQWTT